VYACSVCFCECVHAYYAVGKPLMDIHHNMVLQVVVSITSATIEMVFHRSQYCSLLETMEAIERRILQHRYLKYRDKLHLTEDKKNNARMR